MRIKPVPQIYIALGTKNVCTISPNEARMTLEELEQSKVIPVTPFVERTLASHMGIILAAYKAGKIVYVRNETLSDVNTSLAAAVISTDIDETSLKKELINIDLEVPPEMKQRNSIPLSEMDFEALQKEVPFGKIEPAMPQTLFISGGLQTPCHDGYINNLGYAEVYPFAPPKDLKTAVKGDQFKIVYPNKGKPIVPIPMGAELTSITPKVQVFIPTDFDPLVWKTRLFEGPAKTYTIQSADSDSRVLKANRTLFIPSEAEQQFWQKALPLPQALKSRIEKLRTESPGEIIHLVVSYLGTKNEETGLTNFNYVCNPYFGDFLLENRDDLPLLMSYLKAGHCDYLAWYTAAQLRAFGQVAWVCPNLTVTKDGKHFNGAYAHATVVVVKNNGDLAYFDPTTCCEIDKAYHPKVLTEEIIYELSKKYSACTSVSQKIKVLDWFKKKIDRLREEAEKSIDVMNDISKLRAGYLESLLSAENKFDNEKVRVKAAPARWDYLPENPTLEMLGDITFNLVREAQASSLSTTPFLSSGKSPLIREKLAWVLEKLRERRLFYYDLYIDTLKLPKLYNQHPVLKRKDLEDFFPTSAHYYQIVLEMAGLNNFLSFIRSDFYDQKMGFDLLDFFPALCCTSNEDLESVRNRRYSNIFIRLVREGKYISFESKEETGICDLKTREKASSDFSLAENIRLKNDFVNFTVEFQHACINDTYRRELLSKLGIDESTFRSLAEYFLDLNPNAKRTERKGFPVCDPEVKGFLEIITRSFYLRGGCPQEFRQAVRAKLNKMDTAKSRGRTIEYSERRPYVPGDDLRRLDQKLLGRTDKLYVKQDPRFAKDVSTPLHVVIEATSIYYPLDKDPAIPIQPLQLINLIQILQEEKRTTGREIYICSRRAKNYLELPERINPQYVLACLSSGERNNCSPFLQSGRLPKNLLFVSDNYTEISSAGYLFSRHCNFESIYLDDKSLMVFPEASDWWVKNALPEDFLWKLNKSS